MNGRHPKDELLERYVFAPESIQDIEELEAHLRECVKCGEQVALIREFEQELPNAETWRVADALAVSGSVPGWMLEELARARDEDAAARELLEPFLASPAAFQQSAILTDSVFQTAGVVRELVRASEAAREDRPRHALALADAAITIAESFPPTAYHPHVLASLRGQAWRERANALRYVGRYPDVLAAVDAADLAFRAAPVAEFDLARVDFIRGTALWKMERYDAALPFARRSREVFRRYGDVKREVHAGLLEGGILFDALQHREALECFLALEPLAEASDDAATTGYLMNATGAAYQELAEIDRAAVYFRRALSHYEHLGMEIEKLRTSWSIAKLMIPLGSAYLAVVRLREVAAGFDERGSLSDAALVSLDVAEQLVLAGKFDDVAILSRQLIDRFTAAGMLTSALTALQFLREAAESGLITASHIAHVRTFFRRLSDEPALLFDAPPSER